MPLNRLLVQLLEKRHAPLAARARREALGYLRSVRRFLTLAVIHNLPQRDTETQAHMVIRVHAQMVGGWFAEDGDANRRVE